VKTGTRAATLRPREAYLNVQFTRDNRSLLGVDVWNDTVLHDIVQDRRLHSFHPPMQPNFARIYDADTARLVQTLADPQPALQGQRLQLHFLLSRRQLVGRLGPRLRDHARRLGRESRPPRLQGADRWVGPFLAR
jgi:hypothetical protein